MLGDFSVAYQREFYCTVLHINGNIPKRQITTL